MKDYELICEKVYQDELQKNQRFPKLQQQYNKLWNKLRSQLSKGQINLFLQLDKVNDELEIIEQKAFYRRGFKDGKKIQEGEND